MAGDVIGAECVSCAFWSVAPVARSRAGARKGQCRAHAPLLVSRSDQPGMWTSWPMTHEDDWCGDHAVPGDTEQ